MLLPTAGATVSELSSLRSPSKCRKASQRRYGNQCEYRFDRPAPALEASGGLIHRVSFVDALQTQSSADEASGSSRRRQPTMDVTTKRFKSVRLLHMRRNPFVPSANGCCLCPEEQERAAQSTLVPYNSGDCRSVARLKAAGRVAWLDPDWSMPYSVCQASKGILVRLGSNPVNGSPFAFAQVGIRICTIDLH
jgi:hypothetical protein